LFRHGLPYFGNAVPNAHHGGLARSVQKAAAAFVHNPAAFPAHSNGKSLFQISGEKSARPHDSSAERL
jgi:hypothetical protein